MAASAESVEWWDPIQYGAVMPPTGNGTGHALAETHMHVDCASDIERLVPVEEQADWVDGWHPEAEPTVELIRRLLTSEQSLISELPETFTLHTTQVVLRNAHAVAY